MTQIALTVQSSGIYWRLGLSKEDSVKYFTHLEPVKFILSTNLEITCNAACGTSRKKAFDFNNVKLSEWIVKNNFHKYSFGKPPKLIFQFMTAKEKKLIFLNKKTSP